MSDDEKKKTSVNSSKPQTFEEIPTCNFDLILEGDDIINITIQSKELYDLLTIHGGHICHKVAHTPYTWSILPPTMLEITDNNITLFTQSIPNKLNPTKLKWRWGVLPCTKPLYDWLIQLIEIEGEAINETVRQLMPKMEKIIKI